MNEQIPITELAKADIQNPTDVYTRPLSIEEKTTISETIAGMAEDEFKLSEEMMAAFDSRSCRSNSNTPSAPR